MGNDSCGFFVLLVFLPTPEKVDSNKNTVVLSVVTVSTRFPHGNETTSFN